FNMAALLERDDPFVDLIYWRNVAKTGVVFTGLVVALASLFQLSAITVLSHLCLGVMCVTFPIRFYYKLLELLLSCKALKGQDITFTPELLLLRQHPNKHIFTSGIRFVTPSATWTL
uniref:Reticulon n=1 Tax=Myripristis murdjan TaxID=586833 RepID=A0A667WRZ5_9TELE